MNKITGELHNWHLCQGCNGRDFPHYHGLIRNDAKGRFVNGEAIQTSPVESGPDENGVVETRFSTYRLMPPPVADDWRARHDSAKQDLIDVLSATLELYGVDGASKITTLAMQRRHARAEQPTESR